VLPGQRVDLDLGGGDRRVLGDVHDHSVDALCAQLGERVDVAAGADHVVPPRLEVLGGVLADARGSAVMRMTRDMMNSEVAGVWVRIRME